MKNIFNQRINSIITAALLLLCTVLLPGCERNDILVLMEDSSVFGDGSDGDITITGTVNIADLYEKDSVPGVTTKRGVDKGLNHGTGEYSPRNRRFINATNITIKSGATLTAEAWDGSSSRLGIVWITCTGTFTNSGTIDLNYKGGRGGTGHSYEGSKMVPTKADDGIGPGGGDGAGGFTSPQADGRNPYGTADIGITTWDYIYGSGGGGGSAVYGLIADDGHYGIGGSGGSNAESTNSGGYDASKHCSLGGDGNNGGAGGGAVRIYAVDFINTGSIYCDGGNGGNTHDAGAGGGGSGGTVYIEANECDIGTNQITCKRGNGGVSSNGPGDGSNGSVGRIAIKSPSITGSTTDPVYYNILQGSY